ncbi:hypothetical protein M3Y98_01130400 [Aphelenchoides besseyi]|nr:hypothetical protein M3Y98_01130400 [Aphelenchoides besseyi]KAI6210582.1 hypothetical protein M3Y96_00343500 [Aphelenchoides besseyi]
MTSAHVYTLSTISFFLTISALGPQVEMSTRKENPLPAWSENQFIDCIFCIDYDDFKRITIYGCRFRRTPTCRGNVCYMRKCFEQANTTVYFLYTSGCLNLTQSQYDAIQHLTHLQRPARSAENATQLCEVTSTINTCLCCQASCNNLTVQVPFKEYINPIFRETEFDELAHFRYFLPNDPVLENMHQRNSRDEYFLIKSVMSGGLTLRQIDFLLISGIFVLMRFIQIN